MLSRWYFDMSISDIARESSDCDKTKPRATDTERVSITAQRTEMEIPYIRCIAIRFAKEFKRKMRDTTKVTQRTREGSESSENIYCNWSTVQSYWCQMSYHPDTAQTSFVRRIKQMKCLPLIVYRDDIRSILDPIVWTACIAGARFSNIVIQVENMLAMMQW